MKVDWRKLKSEYVSDWHTSLQGLADKYGISYTIVAEQSRKKHWVDARMHLAVRTDNKLIESLSQEEADDKVRLMKQARFVAGRGLQGIARIAPKTARESKELWEAGAGMQAKILGLDKTVAGQINNTLVTIDTLVMQMEQRKEQKQNG